jgi:hypothetical protein
MATTIEILGMTVLPVKDEFENVVTSVRYTVIVTSDEDSTKSIKRPMIVNIPFDANNFISYDNLTESNVISWIEADDRHKKTVEMMTKSLNNIGPNFTNVLTSELPWNKKIETVEETSTTAE